MVMDAMSSFIDTIIKDTSGISWYWVHTQEIMDVSNMVQRHYVQR
jgi:hypothetical protein